MATSTTSPPLPALRAPGRPAPAERRRRARSRRRTRRREAGGTPAPVLLSTVDYLGRAIVLEQARWDHMKRAQPELTFLVDDVLSAVERPDVRGRSGWAADDWYYRRGARSGAWIKVVVAFDEEGRGRVLTAFARHEAQGA